MKRCINVFLILILLLVITMPAYAGILDRFTDIAIEKVIGAVIAGLFFLGGTIFGIKRIIHWRKVGQEGVEFVIWLYKATRKDSPGGAQITGAELDDGLKEFGELGIAIAGAIVTELAPKEGTNT